MRVRTKNLFRFLAAFAVFTIVFGVLMDKLILPLYVRHGNEYELLDVRHKPLPEARAILESNGIESVVSDTLENSDFPPQTVIDQQPPAGYMVKKGRIVNLIISGGERYFPMPKLVGKVLKAADLELERWGVVVDSVTHEYSSDKPVGVVSAQSISPGLMISTNTHVWLTVSKGAPDKQLEVPDLFGLNLDEARKIIRKSGHLLGKIRYIQNPDLTPYTVIGQKPEAGKLMDNPTAISLDITTISQEEE
ncbi:MAG: PASTA domain-containing protein [Candidatus Neomarinimicrobiota bacterium]